MKVQMSDLNKNHRKRVFERFDTSGLSALSEHEKLEMLLFYTNKIKDTKPIAKLLLKEFGNIQEIFAATQDELCAIEGVGPASARLIKFIQQISLEAPRTRAYSTPVVSSPKMLIEYLLNAMGNLPTEQVRVVFLDTRNRVIKDEIISEGTENQTAVYPRKILKRALALHSTSIILVHNHPAGSIVPSGPDVQITRQIEKAADALGIILLDHIILGKEGEGYFSFRENGKL